MRKPLRSALILITLLTGGALPAVPARAQSADLAPPTHVLLMLDAPSAAEVYLATLAQAQAADAAAAQATATAAAQAQLATVTAQQAALASALDGMGVTRIYSAQRVYNAIAVSAPATRVAELAALPNVRAVWPLSAKTPDNSLSVPFLGAQALWANEAAGSLTGAGITIGIIDTGVDYIHKDFGGNGSDYARNVPTRIDDIDAFPSAKVAGGYDFAGDNYDANSNASNPTPDPDPFDCYGHGTHVAGTAAGYGVTGADSTFAGPYGPETPFDTLAIGPGVAPRATLYALKVFGCSGSSDIVDLAIEWAVDPNGDGDFGDHLDVINLSLGSPFGGSEDSTSVAADRAAQIGIIVVASAGNSGVVSYGAGSPGSANYAISVAATTARSTGDGSIYPVSDTLASFSSRGPRLDNALKPDIAAPGVNISSAQAGSGGGALTLSGTSMAAPHVAGAMALLRQLHPAWTVTQMKALVMNTAMTAVRTDAPYTSTLALPSAVGAGRIDLRAATEAAVVAYNADDAGVVSLSFGSPDVLGAFTAIHNVRVQNTSATPQVYKVQYTPASDMAGVEIKAPASVTVPAHGVVVLPVTLTANSAQMRNVNPVPANATDAGLRAWQSVESGPLWLWPTPATFSAPLASAAAAPTATFRFDVESGALAFTLPPPSGALATLESYTLLRGLPGSPDATAAYTLYTRTQGAPPTQPIAGSVVLQPADVALLASGYLTLRAQGSGLPLGGLESTLHATLPILKLPVYAAPRPVGDMRAAAPVLDFGAAATASRPLALAGTALSYSATPTTTRPLLAVLELHARSPQVPALQEPPTPGAVDIKYVGVDSDYLALAHKQDARIFFGIATYAPWSTPKQVAFSIYIDSDGDAHNDYRIFNAPRGALSPFGGRSDEFMSLIQNLTTGSISLGDPINLLAPNLVQTAIFNSNVMLLSAPIAKLGLAPGNTAFTFTVESRALVMDSPAGGDSVMLMRYNLAAPGLNLAAGQASYPLFTDAPTTTLTIGLNLVAYHRSGALGLLLLHHHNRSDARAEAVDVTFQWPTQLHLPIMAR